MNLREKTPTSRAHAQEPSEWCGRSKHILLSQRGRKTRKIPAIGSIFLLTFPFIERATSVAAFKPRLCGIYGSVADNPAGARFRHGLFRKRFLRHLRVPFLPFSL